SEERQSNAIRYLERLLGGVDSILEKHLSDSQLGGEGRQIQCQIVRSDLQCQSARTPEPFLQFAIIVTAEGFDKTIIKQFALRLPEIDPYRVGAELTQWAARAVSKSDGYCLPVFQVAFYEELMLAKDDEETRRVLLHCIHEERDVISNLLKAGDIDSL